MTDPNSIALLAGAVATVLTAYGGYIVATRTPAPKERPSTPPEPPRRQQDSQPESPEARMSRLEERQAGIMQRLNACEEDSRRVQDEVDEMRTHLHSVEKAAIERLGETQRNVAELTGALSARWGGKR